MKKCFYVSLLMMALFTAGFSSCNSDNDYKEETGNNDFAGYYKITALNTNISVDLNNDGVQSKDLYDEMIQPYHLVNLADSNYTPISMYQFNQITSYAEVRPTECNTVSAKLLLLNLPVQSITYLYNQDQKPYLGMYKQDLSYYRYELDKNNDVVLVNKYGDTPEVQSVKIERKNQDCFVVTYNAKIFDFVSKAWKQVPVKATYERV